MTAVRASVLEKTDGYARHPSAYLRKSAVGVTPVSARTS
jgi:hypothetical protein